MTQKPRVKSSSKLQKCHVCRELKPTAKFTLTKSKDNPRCDDCFSSKNEYKVKRKSPAPAGVKNSNDYEFIFNPEIKYG